MHDRCTGWSCDHIDVQVGHLIKKDDINVQGRSLKMSKRVFNQHIGFIVPPWFYEVKHVNDEFQWLPKVYGQRVWRLVEHHGFFFSLKHVVKEN